MSKSKPKPKKILETTLGKAPEVEKDPDLSHLQQPITTSIHGLKQLLNLFQTSTPEVQEYLTYECDILYECKSCRSIFRSLANFILHKRKYCLDKIQAAYDNGEFIVTKSDHHLEKSKKIDPIIERLIKKQKIEISASENETKDNDDVIFVSENKIVLEKIDDSKVAMFQSVKTEDDLMKSQILEIHNNHDNNQLILHPNGQIQNYTQQKSELQCTKCKLTFSTEKTLTHHIKYQHNKTTMVYPCPSCDQTFTNPWTVYRHLFKIHHKTTSQVRKMRHLIHCNQIRKSQDCSEKKQKQLNVDTNEEWCHNFQMCVGCGKKFERKAALHSHSQMCSKRLNIYNNNKNVKHEIKKNKLKGAAKRKVTINEGDVVITKERVARETDTHQQNVAMETDTNQQTVSRDSPEIYTISDDSNPDVTDDKRSNPWNNNQSTVLIPADFKEYVTDSDDYGFLSTSLNYINLNGLKCTTCNNTFLSIYMLLRHMSLHFSWFRFQCMKCNFTSYHKYDCTTHAYSRHCITNELIDSTVLPIPKWKVFSTCHDFKTIEVNNDDFMPRLEIEENQVNNDVFMPRLEASTSNITNRPIRNRTKSCKIVQNDFIYDLSKAIKLNGDAIKSRKNKK